MQQKETTKPKAAKTAQKKPARATKSKRDSMLEGMTPEEIAYLAWQKSYENRLKGKRLD